MILILGDATRGKGPTGRTVAIAKEMFLAEPGLTFFKLTEEYYDIIPDIRRSRREYRGTKAETVLVYRKEA